MKTDTHAHGEFHVKMKAEIRVMFLQANGHQRLPAKHQKLGENWGTNASLTTLRRNQPLTSYFRLLAPEVRDNKFLFFTSCSLWYFVMVALRN